MSPSAPSGMRWMQEKALLSFSVQGPLVLSFRPKEALECATVVSKRSLRERTIVLDAFPRAHSL